MERFGDFLAFQNGIFFHRLFGFMLIKIEGVFTVGVEI
jgi:hypothetical protein